MSDLILSQNTTVVVGNLSTSRNGSTPEGCLEVFFSQMDFLPWDNPHNIVSAQVEKVARRIKDTVLLPVLFLVGGLANVINMAVFFKQGLTERINLCLFALSLADELYLIQAMCLYGEQLHLQFTTQEVYGPTSTFLANHNFAGFYGFAWVSQIISAIIASERCLCIVSPLKFHTIIRTRTMAVLLTVVFVVVVGFYMLVAAKYHVGCVYDPSSGASFKTVVPGQFYVQNSAFIDFLDGVVFAVGLSGTTMVVVVVTTAVTTVKLRKVVAWRAETSSSGGKRSSEVSAREVALTRMLIGNSMLFIACVSPVALFRLTLVLPDMRAEGRYHNFYLTTIWILEGVSYVNSSFNILVYYAMGSHYRETFKALFSRKNRGNGSVEQM